jgi:hypothetical protein
MVSFIFAVVDENRSEDGWNPDPVQVIKDIGRTDYVEKMKEIVIGILDGGICPQDIYLDPQFPEPTGGLFRLHRIATGCGIDGGTYDKRDFHFQKFTSLRVHEFTS